MILLLKHEYMYQGLLNDVFELVFRRYLTAGGMLEAGLLEVLEKSECAFWVFRQYFCEIYFICLEIIKVSCKAAV